MDNMYLNQLEATEIEDNLMVFYAEVKCDGYKERDF